MNFMQSLWEALGSLTTNKLRSGLTILGIVIGVASVIAMVALGRGVQNSVTGQMAGVGTNQLTIFSMGSAELRNPQPLTLDDAQAIQDQLSASGVRQVAAQLSGSALISYGSESATSNIYGVSANFGSVNNLDVIEGRFLTEEDMAGQTSSVVIGSKLADKLFDRTRGLVGELIRVEGQPYRIVGVLAEKGSSGITMSSTDDALLLPLTTAQTRLMPRQRRGQVDILSVEVANVTDLNRVTEDVSQLLRTRHRTPVGTDDFMIFAAKQLVDTLNQITSVLTIFLGGVAAISLLVGGIGIMNIMLVSVTERTREIGLRKALGARKRDILVQFLSEAAVLSLAGGIIGIILGWLIAFVVGLIAAANNADINPAVGLDAILLATLFSSAIGVFFGLYPANRAANLQPVEALRSE